MALQVRELVEQIRDDQLVEHHHEEDHAEHHEQSLEEEEPVVAAAVTELVHLVLHCLRLLLGNDCEDDGQGYKD